jgi:riboflavin kinase / FMN adenylyltransferase
VTVARDVAELPRRRRAAAIGTFDGVHVGHARVVDAARAAGLVTTAVTFDPHPRAVLGGNVELLCTLERRLELLEAAGAEDVLVVPFDRELARLPPAEFADGILRRIGVAVVTAGEDFRFGRERAGDLDMLARLGFEVCPVEKVPGVSSSTIRSLIEAGEVEAAAPLLGRPVEVEGVVVAGDARGTGLGFPTANVDVDPRLVLPARGIYAGAVADGRAAVSIGFNPHFGGRELRVEAFLLDFDGDLYGQRLVVELWRRLRDERAFASEDELVAQIARDVEETRAAKRPA